MSFSGFSEDDIKKINTNNDTNKSKGFNNKSMKKVTFKSNHKVNNLARTKILLNNNTANNVSTKEVPENAKLNVTPSVSSEKINKINQEKPNTNENNEEKKYKDLEEFETKQKLIEEQNRKRKELLAKALADRTKRTQEEAQRLNEIQEEFKKLDAMLSEDVKILRKKIELVSIEYMESCKKYHKVEKDFLEAKLVMQQKQEKKEMLTEHLCTIIEKNEERKAQKLNELLHKLQLSSEELTQTQEVIEEDTNKPNN